MVVDAGGAPAVVVASDAFKGSLTSLEVADAVRLGILDAAPGARVRVVPVADGGEGTVAAAVAAGWTAVPVPVHGPTGEPVTATVALRGDGVALVEMAEACGLGRLPGGVPAPLTASSRGLGDAVLAALDLGADEVVVGVGGSASTDGGAGMLAALGARLLDARGGDLPDGGAALLHIDRLDLSGLDPRLATTRFVLAADVDSPLLGPSGAAAVFGPQKGATPDDVAVLERGLTAWASTVDQSTTTPPPVPRSTNRSRQGQPPVPRSTNRSMLPQPEDPRLGATSTYWSMLPHGEGESEGVGVGAAARAPGAGARAPGAGAAGGVGFALMSVLGAERRSGIDVVLGLVGLEAELRGADLVVTGEGSLDVQTLAGKAVTGVTRRAEAHGIPVVAVCGRLALGADQLADLGVRAAYPLSDLEPDRDRSIAHAPDLLRRTGARVAADWLSG